MFKTVIIFILTLSIIGLSIFGYRQYQFCKHNIVIIALPKSGSTYLLHLLQRNLGFNRINIYSRVDEAGQKLFTNLQYFFAHRKLIAKEHFRAPVNINSKNLNYFMHPIDMNKMQQYTQKIILHIRDPRQVLISMLQHIKTQQDAGFIPKDTAKWIVRQSLDIQVDWAIENLYPSIIAWINDWIDFKDSTDRINSMQIMLTTYDMLCNDDKLLYNQILKFYDLPQPWRLFSRPAKDAKVRFRTGDKNEWRAILNASQQADVTAKIPQNLKQRFNWQ